MRNFSLKTKASFHRNSKLRTIVTVTTLTAVLVIALITAGQTLGNIFSYITYPYYATRHWFAESTAVFPAYIRSRNELVAKIAAYESQLTMSASSESEISSLRAENKELRSLLSITEEKRIGASVIARPPFLPYDTLLIDSGAQQGIQPGALVYYHDNYALGFIGKSFAQSALVTPFSSPGVTATVFVVGPNIFAQAHGEGGGVIRVRVPQGVTLTVGDTVLAPSLASGLIGTISSVVSEPTEPEQYGFVVLPDSLQSIRFVAVSDKPIESMSYEMALEHIRSYVTPPLTVTVPTTTDDFPLVVTPTSTATTSRVLEP